MDLSTEFVSRSIVSIFVVIIVSGTTLSETVTPEYKCNLYKHKTENLNNEAYKQIGPLLGKRYQVTDESKAYNYYIGICRKGSDLFTDTEFDDGGVLQTETSTRKEYVIGRFTKADIKMGTDWVMLEYENGTPYGSHCNKDNRSAIIMITCNPNADDNSQNMRLIGEENNKEHDCFYMFELESPSVCTNKAQLITFSLSIGSIVVIVFISVAGLYLIAGLVYNRFMLGNKGLAQIPHYDFWQDFGNLQSDGCNFVCRSGVKHEPRLYTGLGDDQLPDDDHENDDSLLPM